jgi:hypothetical protein
MNDFFRHETWTSYFPPAGSGPGGVDLPGTKFMRAHASAALLQMVWSGEFAFANGVSLAAVGRLFGYTGGLITTSQRTAMSQADMVFCDLFVRMTKGGATSVVEEDAIELTEGWRNSQWPDCMVTMLMTRAAASVDMKRMFEYAVDFTWMNFKPKAVAAAKSRPELRALFPNGANAAIVEATLLQLAPEAKASVTLPPHSILEAVGRLARLHFGWLQRSDVCTWSTDAIAAALLERLHGAGLATQNGNSLHTAQDGSKGGWVGPRARAPSAGAAALRRACSQSGWHAVPAQSTTCRCPSWKRISCKKIMIRSARSRWLSQVDGRLTSCLSTPRRRRREKR